MDTLTMCALTVALDALVEQQLEKTPGANCVELGRGAFAPDGIRGYQFRVESRGLGSGR